MDKLVVEWSDEELRVTFDLFDTNKDGKISKDELSQVLQNLGSQASEEELESKKIHYRIIWSQIVKSIIQICQERFKRGSFVLKKADATYFFKE